MGFLRRVPWTAYSRRFTLAAIVSGPAHSAALSLYRIVLGLLFACHGASSLFGILGGNQGHGGTVSPRAAWARSAARSSRTGTSSASSLVIARSSSASRT